MKAATSKTCLCVGLSNPCLAFRFSLYLVYINNKIKINKIKIAKSK